jgi:hypothetical protein
MAQAFLILYGLFALTTPVLVIALYVRYTKLQNRLKAAEEESERQIAAVRRDLWELKKQVAEKAATSASPAGEQTRTVPVAQHVPVVQRAKSESVSHVVPLQRSTIPKPSAPPLAMPSPPTPPRKSEETPPPASTIPVEPQPVQPVHKEEQPPVVSPAPPQPEPSISAPKQPPTVTPPPSFPATLPASVNAQMPVPPAQPKSLFEVPVAASSSVAPTAQTPAASVRTAAPSYSPLRISPAKPTLQERINRVSAFEEALGTNWLQKLGIVLLVLGVASFGIYELAALGSFGKVLVSYVVAAALLAGGIFLEKRERYQLLGRTGIGGGWALFFFTTYALYHVSAMRVLHSLVLDSTLMLLVAAAMAAHTLPYRSQLVTGLAFLLGYSTVALSQGTVYSLSAGVILAIGLVAIVLKMRWYELEVFGILSSYLNHFYWLYRLLGVQGAHGHLFPQYTVSTAMLFFYWVVFRASYIARKPARSSEEHMSTAAAVLNSLLLLTTLRFQSVHPELAWILLLTVGAIELTLAQIVKARREAFIVLTVMGMALILAAAPSHYAGPGNDVAILWLVGMEVFLIAGVMVKEVVFRRVGLFTGMLVALWLAYSDLPPLLSARIGHERSIVPAAVLFSVCTVAYYLNALGVARKWSELFSSSPDAELLTSHSYFGAIAAALAVWAFFIKDWTALSFAVLMLALAAVARATGPRLSQHLQVQYLFFGVLTAWKAFTVNLHLEYVNGPHLSLRLITLPLIAVAFYGTARLTTLRDTREQRLVRGLLAAAGTAALIFLIWVEAPELWRPVAYILFAIVLAEAGRALKYPPIAWHTHLICALAATTAIVGDPLHSHHWHTMPVSALSGLTVIAGFYWLARRGTNEADLHLPETRAVYTWAAAALMLWALFELLHAPWIAVGWITFAVALASAAHWMRYRQLAWQANVVALCAALRTVDANYVLHQTVGGGISLSVVTVSLVAAGLYFVSRTAAPGAQARPLVTFVHSFMATGLLAALMYYQAPNGWLAPLWAGFAMALALVDRKWPSEELPWQAHILSLLAFIRAFLLNLQLETTWHNWSVRLLSVTIVAVIFYATARVVRLPEEWRRRDLHHAYSWAASVLASCVLWHEMRPLGVAVGWAAFGLILFEYGLLQKVPQFRYQAYIALIASFVRIFFVNLTANQTGEFWGSRLYTILPLILIFFFVYAQLPGKGTSREDAQAISRDRAWHVDTLIACLGTASITALLRYQFIGEWVVTAWAALVVVLFAVAYLLDRELFLYQGMAMTVVTFTRGVAHNLFGSGYFTLGDWKGRYFVVGSAVALLLASLFFAFHLRKRFPGLGKATRMRAVISALARRPEQLQFFAAVILLWLMLAVKMNAGMKTVAWGIEGVGIIILALLVKERSFRLTGLALLLLCVAKIMLLDVWGLEARDRYVTLIIVGSALLLVSYLYSRYREAIRQFL